MGVSKTRASAGTCCCWQHNGCCLSHPEVTCRRCLFWGKLVEQENTAQFSDSQVPVLAAKGSGPNLRAATWSYSWDWCGGSSAHSCLCIRKSHVQAALTEALGGSAVASLLPCSEQSPWAIQPAGTAQKSMRRSWDREGKQVWLNSPTFSYWVERLYHFFLATGSLSP